VHSRAPLFNEWSSDIVADGNAAGLTIRPVIYVSACGGACDLNTNITLGAFIANYNGEDPQTGTPWSSCTACNAWAPGTTAGWIYWDYGTGTINGVTSEVTLIVFNGTLAELKSTEVVTAN
jgi:lysozyme